MELAYLCYRILILVFVYSKLYTGLDTEVYIKQYSNSPCPVKICLTLSQFSAKSVLESLKHNTVLLFLPGDYTLESEISIANISNFSMQSTSSNTSSIFCHKDASFKFEIIDKLLIKGFTFLGCGNNGVKSVKDFLLESSIFIGGNESGTALEIDKTKVSLVDSVFKYNTVGSLRGPVRILQGNKILYHYAHMGGVIIANQSSVAIIWCKFMSNGADIGGAIFATQGSNITIMNSNFVGNSATNCSTGHCFGGVLYTDDGIIGMGDQYDAPKQTSVVISESEFSNNTATNGVVLTTMNCTIIITASKFYDNVADQCGGVLWIGAGSTLKISYSDISNNQALQRGGVAYMIDACSMTINASQVCHNSAVESGGVVHTYYDGCIVTFLKSVINSNSARVGGVISVLDDNPDKIERSMAVQSRYQSSSLQPEVILQDESECKHKEHSMIVVLESVFDTNCANYTGGVFNIENADIMVINRNRFVNNIAYFGSGGVFELGNVTLHLQDVDFTYNEAQIGGVIRSFQSSIHFKGICTLTKNAAFVGGGIHAVESILNVRDAIIVIENGSSFSAGGGIYLYHSTLHCLHNSTIELLGNEARSRGGGIHAVNSLISIISESDPNKESVIRFTRNTAKYGGGIFLEVSSELYIFKSGITYTYNFYFTANVADIGGAIFVEDKTNFKTCTKLHSYEDGTNCFVQVVSLKKIIDFRDYISLKFTDNLAYDHQQGGSVLYGGLLDRCTISNIAKYSRFHFPHTTSGMIEGDGVIYFRNISTITNHLKTDIHEISSDAVQICFCTLDGFPDCSYDIPSIKVKKGERFNISLVAVDQVTQPLTHITIYAFFDSSESMLGEGQMAQYISDTCTNITFSVYSSQSSENLNMYPGGPCDTAGKSIRRVSIIFLNCTCPIGFQQKQSSKNTSCKCICDSQLYPFITDPNCDAKTGMLLRDGNFWITNLSHTYGQTGYKYLIYPHCPFDYCLSSVHVNLNLINGADTQCANGRSGLLCGSCKPGLSLSLGSSLCIPCSKAWHRDIVPIFISFFISGILLVASILVLNLTVAIGTLNGIIFYANIIGANASIFFETPKLRFLSIFLSWLNLEIGFNACFFDGMDTYWKTWLQLAFPAYIIMLVIIIIVVSEYSLKFSELIAKRNPVATLATLILLSYTKLLRIIIGSLSIAVITYPNGFHEIVWLPDASIKYLKGKHIALFILGILILLIGVVYTLLLFFWQWLLRHQNQRYLKWIGHQRLCHFIEPYHAPYTNKHRYWTGLLLLARVILYLVFALNKSGDPGVNLIAISAVCCGLLFLKGIVNRVYKNWIIEAINVTCYLNMASVSISTLFLLEARKIHIVYAFISGTSVILLLVLVLAYHVYTEICLRVWNKLRQKAGNLDDNNNLLNISQFDFDCRDSPVGEPSPFTLDNYYLDSNQELSALPDCVSSLQKQRECNAPLNRNNYSSEEDDDSVGTMTPLLS